MIHTNFDGKIGGIDRMASSREIRERIEHASERKAGTPVGTTFCLAILGGVFIGLGGVFYAAVMTGADSSFGPQRILGGLAFSMGLMLVIIAGAELITGNAMMVMAYWRRRISGEALLRNWGVVLAGNAIGALAVAALMAGTGLLEGAHGALLRHVAEVKMALTPGEAFYRGLLCNMLVCLAVWMSHASRTAVGKFVCLVPPIVAFIAAGFEQSVANLYLIPAGMMAGAPASLAGLMGNVGPVLLGNLAGAIAVAVLYSFAYGEEPLVVAQDEAEPAQVRIRER